MTIPTKIELPILQTLIAQALYVNTDSQRSFSRNIKNYYNQQCIVTGYSIKEAPEQSENLVTHHLYSVQNYPFLQFEHLTYGGVPIYIKIHNAFHKRFGNNTTPDCFIRFLEILKMEKTEFNIPDEQLKETIDWIASLKAAIQSKHNFV